MCRGCYAAFNRAGIDCSSLIHELSVFTHDLMRIVLIPVPEPEIQGEQVILIPGLEMVAERGPTIATYVSVTLC